VPPAAKPPYRRAPREIRAVSSGAGIFRKML
jgi:hypothetical protein